MAKCNLCKTDIPDGTEYCLDCQNKMNDDKAKESYLDSLLNSVKNTSEPSVATIKKNYKEENNSNPVKKVREASENMNISNAPSTRNTTSNMDNGLNEDDLNRVDFHDLEDFDQFNFEDDIQGIDNDIVISDKDLFGFEGFDQNELDEQSVMDEEAMAVESTIEPGIELNAEPENIVEPENIDEAESIDEAINLDTLGFEPEAVPGAEPKQEAVAINNEGKESVTALDEETTKGWDEPAENVTRESMDNIIPQEIEDLSEDTGLNLDLDELLNSLNTPDAATDKEEPGDLHIEPTKVQTEESDESSLADMFLSLSDEDAIEDLNLTVEPSGYEPGEAEDEELMQLLNQISGDDPVSDDLKAISEMMNGPQSDDMRTNMPDDVGEVFSDALTAVSTLKDLDQEEEDLPDLAFEQEKVESKDRKGKKAKKKAGKTDEKDKKEKSEKGLFQRLFGNVKNEKTAAKFAEESKKKEIEENSELTKKSKNKKKGKRGAEDSATDEKEDIGSKRLGRGTGDEAAPVDKKAEKKRIKTEKKKAKEAIEVIDEIEEDPGRINRLGATIVFIFFGVLATILILGTNMVSYTLNIQHASDYFSKQKYTEAYYEVYGVELRDEDLELYEKIATVMFVNKQLNSYNNYYNIEQYPQALDSLLKGLKRYDKYIELATYLGVDSDLNYVRDQILAELNKKFNLTEDEADQINKISNMKDYSLAVYDVVLEKMNK